jgi:hypothetical protein
VCVRAHVCSSDGKCLQEGTFSPPQLPPFPSPFFSPGPPSVGGRRLTQCSFLGEGCFLEQGPLDRTLSGRLCPAFPSSELLP